MPRPETVICYICGRECSANSVKFHEKQCAKKWEAERHRELEKEKREEKRRSVKPRQRERVKSESSDEGGRLKRSGSYSKLLSVKLGDETVRKKSLSASDLTGGSSGDDDRELMHAARPNTVLLRKHSSNNSTSKERPGTVTLSSFKARPRTSSVSSTSSNSSSSSHNTTPNSSPKRKLPVTPAAADILVIKDKNSTPTPRKPNFQANLVKCYICGKELTAHSIKIHEVQCMKKWDAQKEKEKKNSKEDRKYHRRSMPPLSTHTSSERPSTYNVNGRFNQMGDLTKNGKNGSLHDEKENEHGTVNGDSSSESSNGFSEEPKEIKHTSGGKLQWHPCYICGREFSSKSLPIHEPQCRKKWEAYKSQKEKLEKRKSLPPKFVSNSSNRSGLSPAQSKIGCDTCSRMFTPRQLVEHAKLCGKGDSPSGKLHKSKTEDLAKRSSRVTCYVCGREFGSGTIISHEPQCLKKQRQQSAKGEMSGRQTPLKDKPLEKSDSTKHGDHNDDGEMISTQEENIGEEKVTNGGAETQV